MNVYEAFVVGKIAVGWLLYRVILKIVVQSKRI